MLLSGLNNRCLGEPFVHRAAIIVLDVSAALIALGGLFDIFTPRLPSNLRDRCRGNEDAEALVRALLRALGGCLVAIGVAVLILTNGPLVQGQRWALALILVLVVPSEGLNAVGMWRVRSPYYVPLGFILLTLTGVVMAAASPPR